MTQDESSRRVRIDDDESQRDLVLNQRDVNEQLVLSTLRAHDAADAAEQAANDLREREDALRKSELALRELADTHQRLREEAETANRLKDDFLATMSHELRTPLNAILGWASLLRRGVHDDATHRALATIERNAKAQTRLIEDMLDVSRIMSGKLYLDIRSVDMDEIARAAVEVVMPTATAKLVRLDVQATTGTESIPGDAGRLQQVLWNLLTNAIKFTPSGGVVSLRVERVGDEARVVIRDDGVGIAREHLPFIFERFRQVDSSMARRHGGLGLGLAIVRHIVELHGGSVSAESDGVGQGSTFTVCIPMRPLDSVAEVERAVEQTSDSSPHSSSSMRIVTVPPASALTSLTGIAILIVDDDDDSRLLLDTALAAAGASVTSADSARAALALMETHHFDILISDIGMPDEDGYAFMRRVRALPAVRGGDIRAVALSAYARKEDARRAHDVGYQAYVTKPVDMSELTKAIAALAPTKPTGG